jgi:hypothetical protein
MRQAFEQIKNIELSRILDDDGCCWWLTQSIVAEIRIPWESDMAKRTRPRKGDSTEDKPPTEEAAEPTEDLDLPWLTAVEEDEAGTSRRSARWGYGAAGIVLVLVAGLFFLVTFLSQRSEPDAEPLETAATEVVEPEASMPAESGAASASDKPKAATPAPRDDTGVPVVQLASFYSKERAARYWERLERRHKDLAGLDHRIVEGSFKGRTVHRVRASGARAEEVCAKLRRSGVDCLPIGARSRLATSV